MNRMVKSYKNTYKSFPPHTPGLCQLNICDILAFLTLVFFRVIFQHLRKCTEELNPDNR